ncbi:MAG TPA: nicotinic acid mononucleotide adenyltransferase [Pricia antarctica]|uniref:Nicotinic acid mononucleotide adenyltransferase n=1 Tax=Pricia antarctica TaxID=641691 RepID=A0A831QPK5_9FLAO|nr:nicotinic acid mononucleotide adenyltransferase [Pricia antarctica]
MKKIVLVLVFAFTTVVAFSQKEKTVKHNPDTNLIETTYYYDNGKVSQEGTFDMAGKLHGEWISYSESGDTVSKGSYNKGVRTGKWLFYSNEGVKEVEFSDNMIASVVNRENESGVVTKD